MNGLRLLPWTTPDGKPCYLSSGDAGSRLNRRADEVEAVQLNMGRSCSPMLAPCSSDRRAHAGELRYLAHRLTKPSVTPCGSPRAGANGGGRHQGRRRAVGHTNAGARAPGVR